MPALSLVVMWGAGKQLFVLLPGTAPFYLEDMISESSTDQSCPSLHIPVWESLCPTSLVMEARPLAAVSYTGEAPHTLQTWDSLSPAPCSYAVLVSLCVLLYWSSLAPDLVSVLLEM